MHKLASPFDRDHTLSISEAQHLASALKVLAEPSRLQLIALLSTGEKTVTRLITDMNSLNKSSKPNGVSQSNISIHLGILHTAGLVTSDRDGSRAWYSLVPNGLMTIAQALALHSDGETDVSA
jgi:ArsR family transcriptional regulator